MERTHYRSVSSRTLVYTYRPIWLTYIRLRIKLVTPMSDAYAIHYTRGVRARYVAALRTAAHAGRTRLQGTGAVSQEPLYELLAIPATPRLEALLQVRGHGAL